MYPFFFDPTMIVIIPALMIAFYAQYKALALHKNI